MSDPRGCPCGQSGPSACFLTVARSAAGALRLQKPGLGCAREPSCLLRSEAVSGLSPGRTCVRGRSPSSQSGGESPAVAAGIWHGEPEGFSQLTAVCRGSWLQGPLCVPVCRVRAGPGG